MQAITSAVDSLVVCTAAEELSSEDGECRFRVLSTYKVQPSSLAPIRPCSSSVEVVNMSAANLTSPTAPTPSVAAVQSTLEGSQTQNFDASPTSAVTTASDKPSSTSAHASGSKSAPSDAVVTGLTPEQVLQELKRSGYVDQLRRRMYDAFVATTVSGNGVPSSTSAQAVDGGAQKSSIPPPLASATALASSVSVSAEALELKPSNLVANSTTVPPPMPNNTPSASATTPDLDTKPRFLTYLSTLLTEHIVRDHSNLRMSDSRGQQDSLLKRLESDPVDHAHRDALGEATVYDLLVKHIVAADKQTGALATKAMLDAHNGWVGKEVTGRIREVIREMVHPSAKDGDEEDEEEEDDDDDQDENKPDQDTVTTTDAAIDTKPSFHATTTQPTQSSALQPLPSPSHSTHDTQRG